jgi:hypothetical protein
MGTTSERVHAIILVESMVRVRYTLRKLEGKADFVKVNESSSPCNFVHNAKRFVLYKQPIIEEAPP